jgi:hypothetical protein
MPPIEKEPEQDIERIEKPDTGSVTIEAPEEDDRDDGDEQPPAAAKGADGQQPRDKTGKWAERKAARATDHREKKAWQVEKEALERRITEERATYARQLAEAEARAAARSHQQAAAPSDPHDAKLADIGAAIEAELKLIQADDTRSITRYNELRRQEQEAIVDKKMALFAKGQQAQQQQQPRNPYDARIPIIESEFPWLTDTRYAAMAKKAASYRNMLIDVEGRPDTLDTDREALAHIQAQFGSAYGLQPPVRPAPATRAAYARPGSSNAPGRDGGPTAIEVPSELVNGTGLSQAQIFAALKKSEQR